MEKSIWEHLKGIAFAGKGRELESASTSALCTYLNSQLLDSMDPAAIRDSLSVFQPIQQLYRQKVFVSYYKRSTEREVGGIAEVSTSKQSVA